MSSTALFLIPVAFAAGFVIAWLLASAQVRSKLSQEIGKHLSAIAGHISTSNELRQQVQSQKNHLDKLQAEYQHEASARAAAEAKLQSERDNLAEQRRLLDDAQSKLSDAFKALASGVMEQSNQQFLALAETRLATIQEKASGDLSQKQQAIQHLVEPLDKHLISLQQEITRLEESRKQAYGSLSTQVDALTKSNVDLRQETGSLITSLRQPHIKGKWGELALQRALELAGLPRNVVFYTQQSVEGESGMLRPDAIVRLPGGAQIVIDAKVPLGAFLKAIEIRTQDEYHEAMNEHAALVREHINKLSSKAYWDQFEQTPDFVVLFLPGESFFSAALEKDPTMIEDAFAKKRIVLASPTTLIALLRAVAYGWRQEQVAENAARISDLGKELYDRIRTFSEHLQKIGSGLDGAAKAYNKAVGSFEQMLLPGARKLNELGVQTTAEIPDVEPTETALRSLAASSDKT